MSMPLMVVLPTPPLPAKAKISDMGFHLFLSVPNLFEDARKGALVGMRDKKGRNKSIHKCGIIRQLDVRHGLCYPFRLLQEFTGEREQSGAKQGTVADKKKLLDRHIRQEADHLRLLQVYGVAEAAGDDHPLQILEAKSHAVKKRLAARIDGSLRPNQVIEVDLGQDYVPPDMALGRKAEHILPTAFSFSYPGGRQIAVELAVLIDDACFEELRNAVYQS